ncbi:DUF305 domain-containing protein [Aquabacterium sp. J223]|uniref:DUF305 domain-containing protein n=1 Tax=Aquabacterium sp. J223 TaxID=2898431 RepID=UPI0021ADC7A8|nr:DUF305 domain-containing protein [Aquabacterium sp. J223]UUX96678.1 DUF305 domain-containing protein [Aquabacterium sp. J223]
MGPEAAAKTTADRVFDASTGLLMNLFSLPSVAGLTTLLLSSSLVLAQSAAAPMGSGSRQMHEQMLGGMQKMQSMQFSGDTDKDFAMLMRTHHQLAIDMAKAEVENGKSPEMKAMARKTIAEQQKEIAQIDKWLSVNK